MQPEIRPPLHVALSYTVLIVAFISLFSYFVMPAITARHKSLEMIQTLQAQDAQFLQAINQYEEMIVENTLLTDEIDSAVIAKQYLQADTPALAGAELQALLRTLLDDAGAVLISASFKRQNEDSAFPMITVNIRLRSSIVSLQQLLHGIEVNEINLFIDNLFIQSRHRNGRVIRDTNEELEIRLDVTGYLNPTTEGQL